ncbi:MAG: hypothetical protein ACYDCL_06570 [Myxococcales bacterium]
MARRVRGVLAAVAFPALAAGCAHTQSTQVIELDPGVQIASLPMQVQQYDCPAPPCGDVFDGVVARPGARDTGWLGELGVKAVTLFSLAPSLWFGAGFDWRTGTGSATAIGPFASSVHSGAYSGQTGLGSLSEPFTLGLPLELRWDLGRFYSIYADAELAFTLLTGSGLVAPSGATSSGLSSPAFDGIGDLLVRAGIERKLDFGRYGVGVCAEADVRGFLYGAFLTLSVHFGEDIPYETLR